MTSGNEIAIPGSVHCDLASEKDSYLDDIFLSHPRFFAWTDPTCMIIATFDSEDWSPTLDNPSSNILWWIDQKRRQSGYPLLD